MLAPPMIASFVRDDEFLVIPDQVAPAVARLEQAEVAAFVGNWLKEFGRLVLDDP